LINALHCFLQSSLGRAEQEGKHLPTACQKHCVTKLGPREKHHRI
jgi:hypothetical protein